MIKREIGLLPESVDVYVRDKYNVVEVDKDEFNNYKKLEIALDSCNCIDAEVIRFLKLIVGKYYMLNPSDVFTVSVKEICEAMRVSPKEAIRIMYDSYKKLSKVNTVWRSQHKGRVHFYLHEYNEPLFTGFSVFRNDRPNLAYIDYEEIVLGLTEPEMWKLIMDMKIAKYVLLNFDEFTLLLFEMLPKIINKYGIEIDSKNSTRKTSVFVG